MPGPTPRDVANAVLEVKENHQDWGAGRILGHLEQEAARLGKEPPPLSAATVRRIIAREWPKLSAEQRRDFRYVHWPETFERGDLPWEAAPAALELVAAGERNGEGRPPVRLTKWLCRVTLAVPDAPWDARLIVASVLAESEARGHPYPGGVERLLVEHHAMAQGVSPPPPDAQTGTARSTIAYDAGSLITYFSLNPASTSDSGFAIRVISPLGQRRHNGEA